MPKVKITRREEKGLIDFNMVSKNRSDYVLLLFCSRILYRVQLICFTNDQLTFDDINFIVKQQIDIFPDLIHLIYKINNDKNNNNSVYNSDAYVDYIIGTSYDNLLRSILRAKTPKSSNDYNYYNGHNVYDSNNNYNYNNVINKINTNTNININNNNMNPLDMVHNLLIEEYSNIQNCNKQSDIVIKKIYLNENISLETISTTSSTTTPSSPSFTSTSTSSHPISSALSTTTTANNNIKISHIYPPRSFLWFPILTIQENITQKSTSAFNLRKRNEFKVNNDKLSFRPQLLRMKFVQNSVQSNLILNSTVKKNNKSTTMSTSTATTADTTTTKSNVTNELLITSPATPTHQISTSTLHYPRPHLP
ncbi:1332_t:CDS:2 [Entrophospora sp. SA101]|nr:2740_t:CDS:2 [Entrophospora sp. SA101]CAJ0830286.1 1332_t:CDS:2 [Entrophospora sp. SA101]